MTVSYTHLDVYKRQPLLRNNFKEFKNITTKSENGFQQLKATLPPKERRGLVLIDPPYELKEDYDLVVKAIEEGYKRFATGTYAIWYPVVLRQQTKRIFKGLEATGIRKILKIELAVRPDSDQRGMTASGMVVINPQMCIRDRCSPFCKRIQSLHCKLCELSECPPLIITFFAPCFCKSNAAC